MTDSRRVLSLECPFDLEAVFTLQYSTEGLKGVLKWIIDHLADLNGKLGGLKDLDSIKARLAALEAK